MGGGGGSSTTNIKSAAADVFAPIAPERTAAEAMPDNVDKALFTGGAATTQEQDAKKNLGASSLVIPLDSGTSQSGGYTEPRTPTGVV